MEDSDSATASPSSASGTAIASTNASVTEMPNRNEGSQAYEDENTAETLALLGDWINEEINDNGNTSDSEARWIYEGSDEFENSGYAEEFYIPEIPPRPASPHSTVLERICIPHEDASFHTRLLCLLLNTLQEELNPLDGRVQGFFRPTLVFGCPLAIEIILADDPVAIGLQLSGIPNLYHIELGVMVRKYNCRERERKIYEVKLTAKCYDVRNQLIEIICFGKDILNVSISIRWTNEKRDFDHMDWNGPRGVLKALKIFAKRKWDQFGVERNDSGREKFHNEYVASLLASDLPPLEPFEIDMAG